MHRIASRSLVSLFFVLFAMPALAVQRTFVATSGSDANTASNCASTTPCRGFGAALTVTDAGGEIIVLSSGGYGSVTIDRSVSLVAPEGLYAGISVFSGNGVTIATAGVNVVLRGLSINGMGGSKGVEMTAGTSLLVEDCVIADFSGSSQPGVYVATPAAVRVVNSLFRNNGIGDVVSSGATASIMDSKFLGGWYGVWVTDFFGGSSVTTRATVGRSVAADAANGFYATSHYSGNTSRLHVNDSLVSGMGSMAIESSTQGAGTVEVSVTNSRIEENNIGLYTFGAAAKLIASGNTVIRNGYGLYQGSTSVFETTSDNVVRDNSTNLFGSTTSFAKM